MIKSPIGFANARHSRVRTATLEDRELRSLEGEGRKHGETMILENGFRFQKQKDYLSQSHRVHREERTPNLCDQVLQTLKGSPNGRPDTSGISPGTKGKKISSLIYLPWLPGEAFKRPISIHFLSLNSVPL